MTFAYNSIWLRNLEIVKQAKQWRDQDIISPEQFTTISNEYPSSFYHPNVMIRILLFAASFIGMIGITGLLALMFQDAFDNKYAVCTFGLIYGIVWLVIVDRYVIAQKDHYKSGITELILYSALLFIIFSVAGFSDFDSSRLIYAICFITLAFAAYRYLDLICTAAAMLSFVGLIFNELYTIGGIIRQLIPVLFIILFTPFYFYVRSLQKKTATTPWTGNLIFLEAMSLMLIYVAGNYFVVRELSQELMGVYIEDGSDIRFAFIFYGLTVIIPALYLYVGIKNKDVVLLRVSLVAIAFSVFTFKYYFSLGHPEITLTLAGVILLGVTLSIFRYLRTPRHGYTRENLLKEKWADSNAQAFIVSQTLGGNVIAAEDAPTGGGGGGFSGGGSTDGF